MTMEFLVVRVCSQSTIGTNNRIVERVRAEVNIRPATLKPRWRKLSTTFEKIIAKKSTSGKMPQMGGL
jgi:hypothetical protein